MTYLDRCCSWRLTRSVAEVAPLTQLTVQWSRRELQSPALPPPGRSSPGNTDVRLPSRPVMFRRMLPQPTGHLLRLLRLSRVTVVPKTAQIRSLTQLGRGAAALGFTAAAASSFAHTRCDSSTWTEHKDASGKNYYYNAQTGVTSWGKPIEPIQLDRERVNNEVHRAKEQLAASLQILHVSALRQRAQEAGADKAAINAARGSADRIAAFVELIVGLQMDQLQRDAEDVVTNQMAREAAERAAEIAAEAARVEEERQRQVEAERKAEELRRRTAQEKQRKEKEMQAQAQREAEEKAAAEKARLLEAQIRAELASMSIPQLAAKAEECGLAQALIDQAEDDDNPEQALCDLIVAQRKEPAKAQNAAVAKVAVQAKP